MPIPIPAILAGAGVLSSLLKSQQYYPAAEAPTKAQIYGDALGAGLGGYLGGSILDPVGGAGAAGGAAAGAGGAPGGVVGPTGAPLPGSALPGGGDPLIAGGGLSGDDRAVLDFLTNGGITGRGFGGRVGGGSIIDLLSTRLAGGGGGGGGGGLV